MEPKSIQDIAPPQTTSSPVELPSGPEIVDNIPVRAPTVHASDAQKPMAAKDDNSSFIAPATPLPAAINKDNQESKTKNTRPKPTLVITVAVLAAVCLAAGVYLKFFSSS